MLYKKMRGFVGAASALALAGAISVGPASNARAAVITSQVGTPAAEGSTVLGATLTGGFISGDRSWSYTGYGVITDTILSATLEIDLIDAEDPDDRLDLYAGTSTSGTLFGSAYGHDDGMPGPWRGLPPAGTSNDNLLVISSALFADIADGAFDVFGANRGMWIWGSNRAFLTITTLDPEPSGGPPPITPIAEPASVAFFGLGLVGLAFPRQRRSRSSSSFISVWISRK